jgi:hypothetical protein
VLDAAKMSSSKNRGGGVKGAGQNGALISVQHDCKYLIQGAQERASPVENMSIKRFIFNDL